jgi:uncharacterized repeat protein (TIGR03803 family)
MKALEKLSVSLLTAVFAVVVFAPGMWAQSKFKTLHAFNQVNKRGEGPAASLVFDATGNLYGTTGLGGAHGGGTVFKLTPNSDGGWAETVQYSFCSNKNCTDGAFPGAGLIFDSAGNLYSTTSQGGTARDGTVFKLTPNSDRSWSESVLYSFAGGEDGAAPAGGLIFDQSGNLYGTTGLGGAHSSGAVFKLTPNSEGGWNETILYSFCSLSNCSDGVQPLGTLISDGAGNLYGTTFRGGDNNEGTVFKLTPNTDGSWTESVLYSFCSLKRCDDGAQPQAGLVFDGRGNLYGTTQQGGSKRGGVAFSLTPNSDGSWTEGVLHGFCSFAACSDGSAPAANLTLDAAGNLYGTAYYGGNAKYCAPGCGVVFELTPNSKGGWEESVLHRFFDHPGSHPSAGLILDVAGNLYGTTSGDGTTTFGSVFEITP